MKSEQCFKTSGLKSTCFSFLSLKFLNSTLNFLNYLKNASILVHASELKFWGLITHREYSLRVQGSLSNKFVEFVRIFFSAPFEEYWRQKAKISSEVCIPTLYLRIVHAINWPRKQKLKQTKSAVFPSKICPYFFCLSFPIFFKSFYEQRNTNSLVWNKANSRAISTANVLCCRDWLFFNKNQFFFLLKKFWSDVGQVWSWTMLLSSVRFGPLNSADLSCCKACPIATRFALTGKSGVRRLASVNHLGSFHSVGRPDGSRLNSLGSTIIMLRERTLRWPHPRDDRWFYLDALAQC